MSIEILLKLNIEALEANTSALVANTALLRATGTVRTKYVGTHDNGGDPGREDEPEGSGEDETAEAKKAAEAAKKKAAAEKRAATRKANAEKKAAKDAETEGGWDDEDDEPLKEITKETVRMKLTELSEKVDHHKAKEICNKFTERGTADYGKLSKIPKEKYPQVIAAVEKLLK